jgi:hypothetical protein
VGGQREAAGQHRDRPPRWTVSRWASSAWCARPR